MKTIVIIQARRNSSRLPAKVLKTIGEKQVLQMVIERANKIRTADEVVVAIPEGDEKTIGKAASDAGAAVFVGDETDVLSRYYGAARMFDADIIVRITSDCPLIDPEICERVIALRNYKNAPYASNVHPRSFPKGLDCEVFTMASLAAAQTSATFDFDREHVTPWIIANCERTNLASGRFDLAKKRWTLDYPEDLKFFQKLFEKGAPNTMEQTLELLACFPELEAINAECV